MSVFTCPNCGKRLVVTATRHPTTGKARRYRRCVACGAGVVTEERVVGSLPDRPPRFAAEADGVPTLTATLTADP